MSNQALNSGKIVTSREKKIDGTYALTDADTELTPGVLQVVEGPMVKVGLGDTINLGNYESARVYVGYSAYGCSFEDAQAVAQEILFRETFKIRGRTREQGNLADMATGTGRRLSLSYGLTINHGKFQMGKADVSMEVPVADGDDLESVVTSLQNELMQRIESAKTASRMD